MSNFKIKANSPIYIFLYMYARILRNVHLKLALIIHALSLTVCVLPLHRIYLRLKVDVLYWVCSIGVTATKNWVVTNYELNKKIIICTILLRGEEEAFLEQTRYLKDTMAGRKGVNVERFREIDEIVTSQSFGNKIATSSPRTNPHWTIIQWIMRHAILKLIKAVILLKG